MRRAPVFVLLAAAIGLAIAPAQATPSDRLPFITGGGHTENNNTGSTENPEQTAFGGFIARATGAATTNEDGDEVYPAEGEVQARTADSGSHDTLLRVHGDVVCIAKLAPTGEDNGGAEGEDIWEIRFQVEHSSVPGLEGYYASLFVQDAGRDDYADENADAALATNANCGEAEEYRLEPHQGQITVHDRS